MFAYPCPHCGHRLLATAERAGQRTICSKCLKPIVIPGPDATIAPAPVGVGAPATVPALDLQGATELDPPFNGSVADLPLPPAVEPMPAAPPPPPPPPKPAFAARPPVLEPASLPVLPPIMDTPAPLPGSSNRFVRPAPPRMTAAAAAPADDGRGMVSLSPTGMDSVDVAAELTAAISMRMRPPPEPPSDLKLSTGLWLTLTAIGVSLWVFSLVYQAEARAYTAVIGAAEVLIGYGWVVVLAYRRGGLGKAAAAVLPPVAFDKMFRPQWVVGYRPARFFVTGLILIALFFAGPLVQPMAQSLAGWDEAPPAKYVPTPTTLSSRLRDAVASGSESKLVDELAELADKAKQVNLTLTADDKGKLVERLRDLTRSDSADVRTAALKALVAWVQEDAQSEAIRALASRDERERRTALSVCGRWTSRRVIEAVVARLSVRDDSFDADRVLREIAKATGPEPIEAALLPLLSTADADTQVAIRPLTVDVGGTATVQKLEELRDAARKTEQKAMYDRWVRAVKERK